MVSVFKQFTVQKGEGHWKSVVSGIRLAKDSQSKQCELKDRNAQGNQWNLQTVGKAAVAPSLPLKQPTFSTHPVPYFPLPFLEWAGSYQSEANGPHSGIDHVQPVNLGREDRDDIRELGKAQIEEQALRTIFPLGFWPSGKIMKLPLPSRSWGEIKNANMLGRENRGHHPVAI